MKLCFLCTLLAAILLWRHVFLSVKSGLMELPLFSDLRLEWRLHFPFLFRVQWIAALECRCTDERCLHWLAQWGSCARQKGLKCGSSISFLARGAGEVCHMISGWPTETFVCLSVCLAQDRGLRDSGCWCRHSVFRVGCDRCSACSPTSWTFIHRHLQLLSLIVLWLIGCGVFSVCLQRLLGFLRVPNMTVRSMVVLQSSESVSPHVQ